MLVTSISRTTSAEENVIMKFPVDGLGAMTGAAGGAIALPIVGLACLHGAVLLKFARTVLVATHPFASVTVSV